MSRILLQLYDPDLFLWINEEAKERWDDLPPWKQDREIWNAVALRDIMTDDKRCRGSLTELEDWHTRALAEVSYWIELVFRDRPDFSHEDLMKYCVAEHGMAVQQFNSMKIHEIVELLKNVYEYKKKVGVERQAGEKPEAKQEESEQATNSEQIIEMLHRNPDTVGWSAQKWSEWLKCSKSTVVESPAWQTIQKKREDLKKAELENARKQRSEPT
jgi:hypothetical protein